MTAESAPEAPEFMTPGEVAARWQVDPKTVTRWAKTGRLDAVKTPGGRRLFKRAYIEALLRGEGPETAA